MTSVIARVIMLFTLEYCSKSLVLKDLVILESLLVGYLDLHFRMSYKLCIICIHYEPVYSSSYRSSGRFENNHIY